MIKKVVATGSIYITFLYCQVCPYLHYHGIHGLSSAIIIFHGLSSTEKLQNTIQALSREFKNHANPDSIVTVRDRFINVHQ